MLKGGYQIINLENKDHEIGVGMDHEGIYDKIEGTRKAILLSGIVIGGVEMHDVFAPVTRNGSNFELVVPADRAGGYYIYVVQDNDVLTILEA